MEKQTETKQEEQSNGQYSTEKTIKEEYLNIEIVDAKPLRLVGSNEVGYCIVFGKYRITDIKQTPDEALKEAETNKWTMIINLIAAVSGKTEELKDKMK